MEEAETPHRAWRWIAFVVVVVNAGVNLVCDALGLGGEAVRAVAGRYDGLFGPASNAFAIWGVIYAGFALYAAYALSPSQRHVTVHDRLSIPLVVANLLATFFIVAFRYAHLAASVLILLASLCNAVPLYVRSRSASLLFRPYERVSCCAGIPFSIYLGWISVAFVAGVVLYLRSIGVFEAVLGETTWTVLMLLVTGVLGLAMAFRFTDGVLAAVISWASFAFWMDARAQSAVVGAVAFAVGLLCASTAVYFLTSTIGPPSFRGPRGTGPRLALGR